MKRRWLLALLPLAACGEVAPSVGEELVAELRALRRQQALLSARAEAPAADAAALRQALELSLQPMRDVVQGLARQQQELQDRQLALTQELQRWSKLLVESVAADRTEESQALTGRLQQLEQRLSAQDAHQREVEALMQRALEHTAVQLEEFLRRVSGGASAGATNTPPPGAADADALPLEPQALSPRGNRRGSIDRWAWFALVAMAAGAGWWFVRQSRRAAPLPPLAPAEPPPADRVDLASGADLAPALSLPSGLLRPDAEAPEIWAAAALLGEAVGRLRQQPPPGAAPSPPPAATAAGPAEDDAVEADDLFVLEGLDPEPRAGGPAPVRMLLPGVAELRALAEVPRLLAGEPAVLRQPAPVVRPVAGGSEVLVALLPWTPGGERGRIEQRLRDALK
jgi:hypothetical protein